MDKAKLNPREPATGIRVYLGKCWDVMDSLDPDSISAIVCDPPYGIGFMGKDFDKIGDGGDQQAFHRRWAESAFRVLKPGGHVMAMGSPRTYHHLAYGLELGGFEIRDSLHWIYGSGFPKSADISKAIDRAAGVEREVVGRYDGARNIGKISDGKHGYCPGFQQPQVDRTAAITAPETDAAKQWAGWGSALKPAHEPIVVARKPFPGTLVGNVQAHGTGALNIEAGRVGTDPVAINRFDDASPFHDGRAGEPYTTHESTGRWPPNVILSHEAGCGVRCVDGCPVAEMDRQSGEGASRYFPIFRYQAKPSTAEREAGTEEATGRIWTDGRAAESDRPYLRAIRPRGNYHPTVKPIELMRWTIKLIVEPGGVVLDPFLGSGTTLCAAVLEGVEAIGIEMNPEYIQIAEARIRYWSGTDEARQLGLEL